ncbi:MAG: GIY-YIG nuclease family protein [Flavobacteriaceae bacterium]|nr:GIY-YIG nuclease family protein [Flavobacteriaceae bacterium]
MKKIFVYILSNKNRTTFYTGFTRDLVKRLKQHTKGNGAKFTAKYRTFDLIYYEEFKSVSEAMKREKQLKNWHREWKLNLIKETNPNLETITFKKDTET